MIGIRKVGMLAVAAVVLISSAVAQSSELSVTPSGIDENVSAGHVHEFQFTVENTGSAELRNVTLGNTRYLNWSENHFNLSSSGSRSVNASIYTEEETQFNTTLEASYEVNGSTEAGPNISVLVDSYYPETNASIEVFEKDFELQFGESDSSVFKIINTGNETAYNVSLTGGNASFDRVSGFRVKPGEDILVQYEVSIPKPEENATGATNQSYSVPVTVSAANFGNESFSASVFVPFKQYDSQEKEKSLVEQILQNREALIEFCSMEENEDSLLCGNQIVRYRNVTETVYKTPKANVTLTESEIRALKQLANERNDTLEKVLRRTKLLESYFDSELQKTESKISSNLNQVENSTRANAERIREMNETVTKELREENREERGQTTTNIILGFAIMIVVVATRADKIKDTAEDLLGHQGW